MKLAISNPRNLIGSEIVSNVIGSVVSTGRVRAADSNRLIPPPPPVNCSKRSYLISPGIATAIANVASAR